MIHARDWTERAWLALERTTATDTCRTYDVGRWHDTPPVRLMMWLGKRVARTQPPPPLTVSEAIAASCKRRWPNPKPAIPASLVEAHGPRPNMRDLFYDLLIEVLDDHTYSERPGAETIMEAFDAAQSAVDHGLARRSPS